MGKTAAWDCRGRKRGGGGGCRVAAGAAQGRGCGASPLDPPHWGAAPHGAADVYAAMPQGVQHAGTPGREPVHVTFDESQLRFAKAM